MTRTRQSVKNIIITIASYVVTFVIAFVSRRFFARYMGEEYLGVNSLFSNIISVMSVVELGFGSAIIYNLYRPFSENRTDQVKSLVNYYKKVYTIIASVIVGLGLILTPFIPLIVGEVTITDNIRIVFWLFVADTAFSYLLTYKRSVFFADQKNYVITIVHTIMYAIIGSVQIATLVIWHNYFLFLGIQIVFHLIENIIISIMANKKYPYLSGRDVKPLEPKIKNDILTKVKGLLFHQIGSSIVLGTDNIIMSMTKSLGVIMVGHYSNYVTVINNFTSLTGQIFSSVTASVGNLLLEKDNDKTYSVYKRILFLNAFLFNFICVSVYVCIEPLIAIWVGEEYILPASVLVIIVANFYIQGMKRTCGIFKNAAGIFYEDRFVPLIESITNLVFSIVLVYFWGVSGIIMGTIVSSMVHWLYDFPKYVYGYLLKKSIKQYLLDYLPYCVVFLISLLATKFLSSFIRTESYLIQFLICVAICLVIPNVIFLVIFFRKNEFAYWKDLIAAKLLRKNNNISS